MSAANIARAAENIRIDAAAPKAKKIAGWLVMVGALLTALFAFWHHGRFWSAYLVAFTYVLSITLGGLFFVIVQHLVRAGWSVVVRRVAEGIAYNMRFLLLLFLPLLFAVYMGYLQPQAAGHLADTGHATATDGEGGEHGDPAAEHGAAAEHGDDHESAWITGPHLPKAAHHMQKAKATYLSFPWFCLRFAAYFLVWIGLSHFFFSRSLKQDESGDPALTRQMQWMAPPAMVLFAFSTSFAGMDLLMALDPYWFSTIFGVYFFAGSFLSFCATLILCLYLLQRQGIVTESITSEHFHDVGKFMFAFVVFWAYIAYSQYMLIWYGNIPEETGWFLIRQTGDWGYVAAFLVLGHFVVPFVLLISRFPKRRPGLLALGAVYVLVVHFVDLFWVVQPQKSPLGHMPVPLLDVFLVLAVVGLYVYFTVTNLRGVNLIPIKDPRLGESLAHENY